MKVRMLKPWGFSKAGDIIDPPVGVAAELIKAGRAIAEVDDIKRDTTPITEKWNKRLKAPTRTRRASGKL